MQGELIYIAIYGHNLNLYFGAQLNSIYEVMEGGDCTDDVSADIIMSRLFPIFQVYWVTWVLFTLLVITSAVSITV